MDLVDRVICIGCGKVEFRKASGKGSRSLMGACAVCQPGLFDQVAGGSNGVPKQDEPKGQQAVVPKGQQGSR